jgi:hypothetical protein
VVAAEELTNRQEHQRLAEMVVAALGLQPMLVNPLLLEQ